MSIRVETDGPVTTVIHDRPQARNAMDPESARALTDAFLAFERDPDAAVAVLWGAGGAFCAGWDLKYGASLVGDDGHLAELDFPAAEPADPNAVPRGPMGPTRLELSKPVIAAVAGPAVAGGMEIALWADIRIMEEDAYMGVYCRRWGIPLVDGGTVRLPRLVGQGRAMEIILTGRKVPAEECLLIGACERVVPVGDSRRAAEEMAHEIARFPQACARADRRSVLAQHGLPVRQALRREWANSIGTIGEGLRGAARFAGGKGRHGDFGDI
ncbi:MAG: crotonase/enoyl-CoA hydratase family protein [Hyphomicrobiales bacterium]|nr:crotonase/enoyl-CoA hydratase family protein [Hyphomicrobiales bacterium]MCP5374392.1 crotonase/enoyl-CoA hydratase family protein [Hyphomicrobiales bacterium]